MFFIYLLFSISELATNYKEDGNFNFKHSKYRMAIISYTEGIKAKSINNTLNAELYNNRAAAQFFLKNYRLVSIHLMIEKSLTFILSRSCYFDCKKAISLQPNYMKPIIRGAKCCLQMKKEDDCIFLCDKGLEISGGNDNELVELKKKALYQKVCTKLCLIPNMNNCKNFLSESKRQR
jgi:tetratricopeptide (TPR) repeat protein